MDENQFGKTIETIAAKYLTDPGKKYSSAQIAELWDAFREIPADKINLYLAELFHYNPTRCEIVNMRLTAYAYGPDPDKKFITLSHQIRREYLAEKITRVQVADRFDELDKSFPGRGLALEAAKMRGVTTPKKPRYRSYLEHTSGDESLES